MNLQNPHNLTIPESVYGGGLILPYLENQPEFGENIFLAPNTSVIGSVKLGNRVSIWFGSVLRGDIAPVEVGEGSNIQDNSVLHVADDAPCIVGKNVVVGHNAILHGCTVEDECLIGMGAIVLNYAVVGRGSIVGAGAVVTQKTIIPECSLVLGNPGKVIRQLTPEEIEKNVHYATKYQKVAMNYLPLFEK